MNERGMVIAFINFTFLILGVGPIIAGLMHGDNIKIVGLANIQFGVIVLALLFAFNAYCYVTSGSQAVGKHFSKSWLLYGFFIGILTAIAVFGLAAADGRSPYVFDDKLVFLFGKWELSIMWASLVLGSYCLGVYHAKKAE